MVVKLNVWLHPYFRADPICFKSEPLTGLDRDLGLIVSRLWVGLGHQMAQWPHMYNAGKIFFTIVFYGKKEKQLTKPFTFWKWKLILYNAGITINYRFLTTETNLKSSYIFHCLFTTSSVKLLVLNVQIFVYNCVIWKKEKQHLQNLSHLEMKAHFVNEPHFGNESSFWNPFWKWKHVFAFHILQMKAHFENKS